MCRMGVEIYASIAFFYVLNMDAVTVWIKEGIHMYNRVMLVHSATYFEAQEQFFKVFEVRLPIILKRHYAPRM